ncbi:MAG: sulfatase [Planctomycetota bacterium]
MDRRQFLQAAAGGTAMLAALGPFAAAAPSPEDQRPPNFVVVYTDDLGYGDIGCFGATDIDTPRIDRMADEGTKFTDFYSCAPVCTPARAAIMTGCYAQRVGLNKVLYARHDECLNPDEVTLAEICKWQGYATAIVGKWHLGGIPPTRHGFDEWIGTTNANERRTNICTEAALDFMRRHRDQPFFVYLAHADPHVPLTAFPPFKGRSKRGLYGDVIETLDWSTGRILDEVDRLGLADNTLVIFTSDNGPWLDKGAHGGNSGPLRGGKFKAYEGGHRVPCVMWWPGTIPEGGVCSEVAAAMDFLPTFAGLCGAQVPTDRTIDGRDVLPLILEEPGATSPHEAYFYSEAANPTHLRAVRSERWKLFGWPEADTARPGWYPTALYDLEEDIGETTNVAGDHPEVAKRLRALLDAQRRDLRENSRPPEHSSR